MSPNCVNLGVSGHAPGWYRWAECNAALREELIKLGCEPFNDQNIPKSLAPDGSTAIYATSGNLDTGLRHRIPSTQNPRGPASRKVWDPNQLVLPLAGDSTPLPAPTDTWILMYYHHVIRAQDVDIIRAELSLPGKVSNKGRILGWKDRIILPPIDLTHEVSFRRFHEAQSEAIDVHIRRKGA